MYTELNKKDAGSWPFYLFLSLVKQTENLSRLTSSQGEIPLIAYYISTL